MGYTVGDATPDVAAQDGVSALPNLDYLARQPRPKEIYDEHWRQVGQMAGPAGATRPLPNPLGGMSSTDFNALQLSDSGPNTTGGGLSMPDLRAEMTPGTFSVMAPPPAQPDTLPGGGTLGKAGQLTLDLIHPFTSFAQATGPFVNPTSTDPMFGYGAMGQDGSSGIDPMKFLAARNVGLLENAPTRALDYLVAPFEVALRHLTGGGVPPSTTGSGLVKYAFQKDPNYWAWVGSAPDEYLQQQARVTAQEQAPGWQNDAVAADLLAQFKKDRNVLTAMSSGDEAIDYRAKQNLAMLMRTHGDAAALTDLGNLIPNAPQILLPAIPILGTQLAQFIQPVEGSTEKAWASLRPDERAKLLQSAGYEQMAGSFVATLPLFAGFGAIAAFGAKAAETATIGVNIGTAYKLYSTGLNVLTQAMKAGVGVALLNWSAEIAVPGYTDLIGREIDESRPFSNSPAAAAINALGYFASPVDVVGPYLGLASRPIRKALGAGLAEIPIFKYTIGGRGMDNVVGRAFRDLRTGELLDQAAFDTSAKRLTLSTMTTKLLRDRVSMWTKALREGDPAGNFPTDMVSYADRLQYAQNDLDMLGRTVHSNVADVVATIEASKIPPKFWSTSAARDALGTLKAFRDRFESDVAQQHAQDYGPEFIGRATQEVGGATVDGMRNWIKAQADRMGWTVDWKTLNGSLRGDADRWMQLWRKLYHVEYDHLNGVGTEAAKGAGEADRWLLARQSHLFNDQANDLLSLLRGPSEEEIAAGAVKPPEAEVRAKAWAEIQRSEELSRWWAELVVKRHSGAVDEQLSPKNADTVPLDKLASYLEEITPSLMHRRMPVAPDAATASDPFNLFHLDVRRNGLWDVAFKPQYAHPEGVVPEGPGGHVEPQFVAFHDLGDGNFLQSPYLDYPMESADLIRLGGQGYLADKADSLFRGWRTWRITQFQKGMLHRMATRYDGVTAAQAERFFGDLQDIARERTAPFSDGMHVTPQAAARLFREDVQRAGEAVFGSGELRNLDSGLMERPDWARVAQESMLQSMKLNLTAGITSRLKAMPNGIGDAALLTSDFAVPLIRFRLSLLFRMGEFVESKMLNAMRMGFDGTDPMARPLYMRGGISRESGNLKGEQVADPMAGGLATNHADPATRTGAFMGPTQPQRIAPIEAATHNPEPTGIDIAGGPDAPMTDADRRYADAQTALDRAEYGLATSLNEGWWEEESLNQPERFIQDPESPTAGAHADTDAWMAYVDAHEELLAARADLPEAGYLDLIERANAARTNLARTQHEIEQTMSVVQRDLGRHLAELDAIAAQLPKHAPESPDAVRLYHGTPAAFTESGGGPAPAYKIGSYMHPTVPAHEEGYVYTPGYGDLADYRALGIEPFRDWGGSHFDPTAAPRRTFDDLPEDAVASARLDYADFLMRVRKADTSSAVTWHRDLGASQVYVEDHIPPDFIEFYGNDGGWHPILEQQELSHEGAEFSRDKNNPTSLYGPGTYLTDTPTVAKGYAGSYRPMSGGGQATVYGVDVPHSLNRLDLEGGVPADLEQALADRAAQEVASWAREIERRRKTVADFEANHPELLAAHATDPATAAAYAKAKAKEIDEIDAAERYFKMASPEGLDESLIPDGVDSVGAPVPQWAKDMADNNPWIHIWQSANYVQRAGDIWTDVRDAIANDQLSGSVPDIFLELNAIVESTGYDAMTHTGGNIVGGGNLHNVTIVFDPKNAPIVEANLPDRIHEPGLYEGRIKDAEDEVNGSRAHMGRLMSSLADPRLQAAYDEAVKAADAAAAELAHSARQAGPPPATEFADMPGQAEYFERAMEARIEAEPNRGLRGQLHDAWDPREMKEGAARDLAIRRFQKMYPDVLERSVPKAAQLLRDMGVPRSEWADFMVADKIRLQSVIDDGSPEAWQALFAHADKYREASTPTGMVRLYRGDTRIGGERGVPDWMKGSPEYEASKAAEGRWFTDKPDRAQWYVDHQGSGGKGKVSYVDVPKADAEAYRVANNPEAAKFSGRPDEEWFVPRDVADAGRPVTSRAEATAQWDELMASPEWNTISTLWRYTAQAAADESFGVHFFARNRSSFARSVNHPLLGVYPAAWAYKAASEWFRFLYDNRAFGNGALHLGMAPAVAIAHIEDQQNRLLAMNHETVADLIGQGGAMGSTAFMFNLLLPGDWSGIPFPFSRSIRMLMRGDFNPADHLIQNFVGTGQSGGIGAVRDLRLFTEAGAEIGRVLGNAKTPADIDFDKVGGVFARGSLPGKPKDWRSISSY